MVLKDTLAMERKRDTVEECRTLHLVQEGTFFRAYEWSAWLCFRYVRQFKVTRRSTKSGDDSFLFVGFPTNSLEKFIPENSVVISADDGSTVAITLPDDMFPQGLPVETMRDEFENWKMSVPVAASKKKGGVVDVPMAVADGNPAPARLTDVMAAILAFPIERHSPMECMDFLAELKQRIAKMI